MIAARTEVWYASPNKPDTRAFVKYDGIAIGADAALLLLRNAQEIADGRRAAVLFADAKRGEEIREIAHKLTRTGREVGVRLELQW